MSAARKAKRNRKVDKAAKEAETHTNSETWRMPTAAESANHTIREQADKIGDLYATIAKQRAVIEDLQPEFGNPFNPWDGEYDKEWYDVLTPDAHLYKHCWPNAGKMMATDGSGKTFSTEDCILVRKSSTHPMETIGE